MLEALARFLNSIRPLLPLQLTEDFTRLEAFVNLLGKGSPQEVEVLMPLAVQHTFALIQEFMRLNFIENIAPIFARMMTGFFGSVEEEVEKGIAELEEFLRQHGGETS